MPAFFWTGTKTTFNYLLILPSENCPENWPFYQFWGNPQSRINFMALKRAKIYTAPKKDCAGLLGRPMVLKWIISRYFWNGQNNFFCKSSEASWLFPIVFAAHRLVVEWVQKSWIVNCPCKLKVFFFFLKHCYWCFWTQWNWNSMESIKPETETQFVII